jgi:hypothetical protein
VAANDYAEYASGVAGAPVILHFSASTWRFRLGAYARGLRQPSRFVPILAILLVPIAIDRSVALLVPSEPIELTFALMGVVGAAAVVAMGALVTVLRRVPATTITFDDDGIHEIVGGKAVARGWSWIESAAEDERRFTLYCNEPMRTFRLAAGRAGRRILVVDKLRVDAARMGELLRAHAKI